MTSAAIVLAEGFEDVEAVTVIDVLRRADFSVDVAGFSPDPVSGARGVRVIPDRDVNDLKKKIFDVLVLPGGTKGAERLAASPVVREMILAHHRAGKFIAAICAAPAVVLAPLGILDGKRAACFPGFESKFPASVRFEAERVVVDGNLITSRAMGTAMEFSLAIVAALRGRDAAEKIRSAVLA